MLGLGLITTLPELPQTKSEPEARPSPAQPWACGGRLSSPQRRALRCAEWQKLARADLHSLLQGAADLGVREAAVPQTSSAAGRGIPKALFPFLVPPAPPEVVIPQASEQVPCQWVLHP